MADDILRERGTSLEEEFFRKQNAELVERLRAERARDSEREQMVALSGISDAAVLDRLVELGITPATFAALALAPLVAVAWADGRLEPNEKKAVLQEATKSGLSPESAEYDLLEEWLESPPDSSMMETWTGYARSLAESLDEKQRRELRESTVKHAEAIADAAGGFAGRGKRSAEERKVISAIEAALGG